MNICASCQFCIRKELGTPRANCDYNIVCSGFDHEMIPCQDPVLGLQGYSKTNDLGGFIFCATTDKARPTCRSKNPMGECKKFKAKQYD